MTNEPTVSIILPNRNYADFIPDAIASIKAQTLTDWECIIIDDASTDNSVEVINGLIADDKRFELIINPVSKGVSACRNLGLNAAKGEYISFLDSDDCYAEYFLEMMTELAWKAGSDIVSARVRIIDNNFHFGVSDTKWNTYDYSVLSKKIDIAKQLENCKWVWRRIYKRNLLQDVRFREELRWNGDDVMFALDLFWRVPRIVESNIIGIYHRDHDFSMTNMQRGFDIDRMKTFPVMFKCIREELFDKYDEKFWQHIYNGIFLNMIYECLEYTDSLTEQDKKDLRKVLSNACSFVATKYLPLKNRLLCRYLRWIK